MRDDAISRSSRKFVSILSRFPNFRDDPTNSGTWTAPSPRVHHLTNVNEDGSIPGPQPVNWTTPGLNNFRQNAQPEGEFSAPDLIVSVRQQCPPLDYGLVGRVRNIGAASVPPGVPVRFFEGDPKMGGVLLGMGVTSKVLYPAEAEDVVLLLPDAPPGVVDGSSVVWVVVDDEMAEHPWHECRVDNNSASGDGKCPTPG